MNTYFAYLITNNSNALMNIIECNGYFYTLTKKNTTKLIDLRNNPFLTMEVYESSRTENLTCEIISDSKQVQSMFNQFTKLNFNYFGKDNTNLVLLKMHKR